MRDCISTLCIQGYERFPAEDMTRVHFLLCNRCLTLELNKGTGTPALVFCYLFWVGSAKSSVSKMTRKSGLNIPLQTLLNLMHAPVSQVPGGIRQTILTSIGQEVST